MEPFYFKSYDKTIGIAHDVNELEKEIERLGKEDPACVEWHLKEGHIVAWLNYIGERGLAEMLKGVGNVKEALARIREFKTFKGRQKKRVKYYNR
ncbi:hypothetical protein GFS03_01165 [Sulfolobus sp. E5-1-F]|uniref:hypothetical protein n=1 Tax=Sulfolobaceae TaxID=118883 RepID=UPI0012952B50|nr:MULTISPECIES: hypothetical protein [unclassified Sulfolobus]QGA53302.1 hypothetical protein GFS03_01165 [Sulfolobus sp. E5-1-F]QGA68417.1 hypothetical protein GFS33_06365 [Sulfolobus sp. E11-6]